MAKALTCEVQLTGCATRSDGSLSLRFGTPELRVDEKAAFMELQGLNAEVSDGGPLTHDKPAAQSRRSLH